jgi:hypothetical protein
MTYHHIPLHRLCFIAALIIILTFKADHAGAQSWEPPYDGSDSAVLYNPDQNAVYIRYGWENKKTDILVIKGKLPKARYYSYNLYDDRTKGTIVAIADFEVKPDQPHSDSYTIYVVPEKLKGQYPNQIIVPDSVVFTSVFLRYYLSENGILAGVPLPVLNWKQGDLLQPVSPSLPIPAKNNNEAQALEKLIRSDPKRITKKERQVLTSPTASKDEKDRVIAKLMTVPICKQAADPNQLGAFNYNSSGNYPNRDNHYIVMPVNLNSKSILVVRFKAPTHAVTLGDISKEVRYYSLSQGNEYTNTSITMHDNQLRVSPDGFIYVVVAKEDADVKAKAASMAINFMPLLYKERIVLILRHMLPSPSFSSSTREVPIFDNRISAGEQSADKTIGAFFPDRKVL